MKGLDIGCGDKLKAIIPGQWIGIDKHDFSRVYVAKPDLTFIQHDAKDPLPFEDESFDMIWCHHFLEHLPPRHPERDMDFVVWLVNEMGRILKVGCEAHLIVPWKDHTNAWRAPHHYRFFNHETFQWFSQSPNMWAEHEAAGLATNWQVVRCDIQDECHVYGILKKKLSAT